MTRVTATYDIESPVGLERAAGVLAGEQSTGTFVRLASETDELRERSAARVEQIEVTSSRSEPSLPSRLHGDCYERGRVTISWPTETFGTSLPTLFTTVAGNLTELAEVSAVRLLDIGLPTSFVQGNPGPNFGAAGTYRLMDQKSGPLIGTIIKPSVGLDAAETAQLVDQLLEAGIDFIKDDELQANGPNCPLADRIEAVTKVLNRYADATGKRAMYAFNITDEVETMWRNLDLLETYDGICAMVCLNAVGLSGLRAVRDHSEMAIHGHRAGWGLFSRSPDVGISFIAMQKLWRLAGADHLHVNGLANKFTEPDEVVAASAKAVQQPIGPPEAPSYTAMPVYSSGQTVWQMAPSRTLLGNDDFIFCSGGGIMSHPDGPGAGVRALRDAAEAAHRGISLETFATERPALLKALDTFKRPDIDYDRL